MSGSHHHARIVEPVLAVCNGHKVELRPKTPVRRIRLQDGGVFFFEARRQGAWFLMCTELDLPAFTDKGRAARELRSRARASDLHVGRPLRSNLPASTTVSIRVTQAQKRELRESANQRALTISDAVLGALVASGLVTP